MARLLASCVLLALAVLAHAGTERYEYDSLGRLIRYINASGSATEYVYDAVGNILEVRRNADTGPPTVTLVNPPTLRRGQSATIQVQGTRLTGAQVAAPHATLDVTGLRATATMLSFVLSAGETAPLGPQSFSVSNAFGSASFSLAIEPALPKIVADPSPVVLLPAGQQQVTLRLSGPDQVTHTVTLTVAHPAVASVSPTSIQFAPGQTQATVTVSAVAVGTTALELASATLAGAQIGVFVTTPVPAGPATRYAPGVGVVRPAATQVTTVGPIVAPNVGVLRPATTTGPSVPIGPVVAPNVGVARPALPGQSNQTVGPLVAPYVGVDKQ